ncbi:MAG TPA: methyltransferase domain-containing protein [Chthoniobacterales bacterium]|nr:methyltransferase domain-containing protein [Chthoniobacterales bacterium]
MDSATNPGRLPKLEGIDYKQAAIDYPGKLSAEGLHYLRTKPFYNLANKLPKFRDTRGMDPETHREFCDFANLAVAIELPPGARILDVACGSGWLSEYFARLGYDVTGIDISPDLIRISEDRVRGLSYGVDHETALRCRFLVHDVESAPLGETFDALVCYDAMHHFADEQAVSRNLAAMLNVGGLLFILEGTKPPQDSPGEAELIDVMQRFETLESPFEAAYLRQILDQNGFAVVGDYVSVNALIDREALDAEGRIRPHLPAINYLLCKKVAEGKPASSVPDSRAPSLLSAAIELDEPLKQRLRSGAPLGVRLKVSNTGDTLWLGGNYMRRGAVTLGVKILDAEGNLVDEFHGEPALPRAMAPGEKTVAVIERAAPAKPGSYSMKIDLVDQHVCWFEERGSRPLVLPMEVG